MNLSDEKLIAYADGEVSPEERRDIEAALKTRSDLAAFVERQRALRQRFDAGFAPIMDEEVPAQLLNALAQTPVSARWRRRQQLSAWMNAITGRRFLYWSAMPAAAALACGLVIGVFVSPPASFRVDRATGAVIAQGAVSTALDTQLASTQQPKDGVRIGISFAAKDGRYCRTFTAASLAGVACRDPQGWAVAALAATPKEDSTYRMAGAMPDVVRNMVKNLIAGEPLDASGEMRARAQNWKTR